MQQHHHQDKATDLGTWADSSTQVSEAGYARRIRRLLETPQRLPDIFQGSSHMYVRGDHDESLVKEHGIDTWSAFIDAVHFLSRLGLRDGLRLGGRALSLSIFTSLFRSGLSGVRLRLGLRLRSCRVSFLCG